MSDIRDSAQERERTPVDDVRVVRERLSREAQGDVRRLIAESEHATDQFIKALGLRRVTKLELESKPTRE